MKYILLSLAIILSFTAISARSLTGVVFDESGQPLPMANIVVRMAADSSFVAGVATDPDGHYRFDSLPDGIIILTVSSIGYDRQSFCMGERCVSDTIWLKPASIALGDVTVTAVRPRTRVRPDGYITEVANSVIGSTGTAADMLLRLPMLVKGDKELEVFGKGKPIIFIDSRRVLDPSELKRLNASDIKSVEVLTDPGAAYDPSADAVIRITTIRPASDGFSAALRSSLTSSQYMLYLTSINSADMTYTRGPLDIFANFGFTRAEEYISNSIVMQTRGANIWSQHLDVTNRVRQTDMSGKIGFACAIPSVGSVGAFYSHASVSSRIVHDISALTDGGNGYRELSEANGLIRDVSRPDHLANLYFDGHIGPVDINLNVDYLHNSGRKTQVSSETIDRGLPVDISSVSHTSARMLAQRLVASIPVAGGKLELGAEYTDSRFITRFTTGISILTDDMADVSERNLASFLICSRRFGQVDLSAGLRYQSMRSEFLSSGTRRHLSDDYFLPSLTASAPLGNLRLSLAATSRTSRPAYTDLDGTVYYVNHLTLQSGNPHLRSTTTSTISLKASWRQLYGGISLSHIHHPVFNTIVPYGNDGMVKLLTKDNFPSFRTMEAFIGGRFSLHCWNPSFNIALTRQNLRVIYRDHPFSMSHPTAVVSWLNEFKLPSDLAVALKMQYLTAGDMGNTRMRDASSVDLIISKAFMYGRIRLSLEGHDLFNHSLRGFTFYNRDVILSRHPLNCGTTFTLSAAFRFNSSTRTYRGSGAGNDERLRF